MPFLTAGGRRLDHRRIEPARPGRPDLVFLHEGLGSAGLWRDFPDRAAAATGCGALVYSRAGYGRSDPADLPRRPDYLAREALDVLPEVLERAGIRNPVLVGHSDGASISILHAGAGRPVAAAVLMAPHVFVEDVTVAGIRAAVRAYEETDLRARLARHHDDPDAVFRGWSDAWLAPEFRDWNIEASLPGIACPLLLVQGADDEYGTAAQLDAIERGARGPARRLWLEGCGHSPWRERPEETLAALARLVEEAAA